MIQITEITTRPLKHPKRALANVKVVLNDTLKVKVQVMAGGIVRWPKVENIVDATGPVDSASCLEANELIVAEYLEQVGKVEA